MICVLLDLERYIPADATVVAKNYVQSRMVNILFIYMKPIHL